MIFYLKSEGKRVPKTVTRVHRHICVCADVHFRQTYLFMTGLIIYLTLLFMFKHIILNLKDHLGIFEGEGDDKQPLKDY